MRKLDRLAGHLAYSSGLTVVVGLLLLILSLFAPTAELALGLTDLAGLLLVAAWSLAFWGFCPCEGKGGQDQGKADSEEGGCE